MFGALSFTHRASSNSIVLATSSCPAAYFRFTSVQRADPAVCNPLGKNDRRVVMFWSSDPVGVTVRWADPPRGLVGRSFRSEQAARRTATPAAARTRKRIGWGWFGWAGDPRSGLGARPHVDPGSDLRQGARFI